MKQSFIENKRRKRSLSVIDNIEMPEIWISTAHNEYSAVCLKH